MIYVYGRIHYLHRFFKNSMTKRHYEVAIAVTVTLIAVFGFLWFSGVEDKAFSSSLPATAEGALNL